MPLGARFADVLSAALTGDDRAFADIYRDLAPVVVGYVRGKGAREPDDVVAETFVAVARNLGRFTGDEAAFRSWVFTIAHRRLIDERRARGRRHDDPHDPATMPGVVTSFPDLDDGADVEALLAVLTPHHREVVLQRVVGGHPVKEGAPLMDKRESAVNV
ncbi:MAG: RNA polymerase sigma factor, partial [Actinomycetota bacterium]